MCEDLPKAAVTRREWLLANKWEIVLLRGDGTSWRYIGLKFRCSPTTARKYWPEIRRACRKQALKGHWPHLPPVLA